VNYLKLFKCAFGKHEYLKPDREAIRLAVVQCKHCKTEKVRIDWDDDDRKYYCLKILPWLLHTMEKDPKFHNFLIHGNFTA